MSDVIFCDLMQDVGYVKEVTAKGKGADATPKKGSKSY